MGELNNGRTLGEIKAALVMCSEICFGRSDCPYYDGVNERCQTKLTFNALSLIERLESERDAALAYMKEARICTECAYWDCGIDEPCIHCDFENNCFEWRGIEPSKEDGVND